MALFDRSNTPHAITMHVTIIRIAWIYFIIRPMTALWQANREAMRQNSTQSSLSTT